MAGRKTAAGLAGWLAVSLLVNLVAVSSVNTNPDSPDPNSDEVQEWAAAERPEVAAIKPEVRSAIETGRQLGWNTVPTLQQQQQQQQQKQQKQKPIKGNSVCVDDVQCTTPVNASRVFSLVPLRAARFHAKITPALTSTHSTPRLFRKGGVFGYWCEIPKVLGMTQEVLLPRRLAFDHDDSPQQGEDSGRSAMRIHQSTAISSPPLTLLSIPTFLSSFFGSLRENFFPGKQFAHEIPSHDRDRVYNSRLAQTVPFRGVALDTSTKEVTNTIAASDERGRVKPAVQEPPQNVVSGNAFQLGDDCDQKDRRRRSAEDETQSSAASTASTSAQSTGNQSRGETFVTSNPEHSSLSLELTSTTGLDDITSGYCGRGGNWSCRGRCGHPPSLPCSCDALCRLTGHCCEDFQSECPPSSSPALALYSGRQMQCTKGYMLVSDCPEDWAGTEVERLCRTERRDVIDDVSPVSSVETGVGFANVHCARCNGVSDVKEWVVLGDCIELPMNYSALHDWCRFTYQPPEEHPSQRCTRGGLFPYYESCPQGTPPSQQDKCLRFHSYVRTMRSREGQPSFRTFRNVHCLECWSHAFPDEKCLEDSEILSSLESFHSGNFLVLMKWSLGTGTEMQVSEKTVEGSTSVLKTWNTTCNSLGECTDKACPKNTIKNYGGCVTTPFVGAIEFYFSSVSYSVRVRYDVMEHFKKVKELNPESVQFCNTSETPEIYNDVVTVKMMCGEGFTDIGDYQRTAMISDLAEQTVSSLPMEAQSRLDAFCTKWPFRTPDTLCSKPPVAGSALGKTQDEEVSSFLRAERFVSLTGSSLSVVALSVRVALQWWVPTFRSVPAKLQMCLTCCLLVAYLGFLSGAEVSEGSWGCWAVAVLTDAAFLASFLWMNVFVFLLWRSLAELRSVSTQSSARRTLLGAGTYCATLCALLVGAAVTFDLAFPDHAFSPRFAKPGCWFNGGWGLLVFFAAPSLLVSGVNFVLVLLTLRLICKHHMRSRDDNGNGQKGEVGVAVRLVTLTGVTWLVGLAAALTDEEGLWMTFTLLNSLMGFGVGLNLVLTRRNLRFFRQKYQNILSSSDSTETRSTT